MDKRLAYLSTLEELIGKNTSIFVMPIPGTELSRAKENLRLLVKIGKKEENEEKIQKIDRAFIDKIKTGLVKLKENEENQRMTDEDDRTNPITNLFELEGEPLPTNPLHNNSAPSTTLQSQSSTSLNPNQNQQNQGR